MGCKEENKEEKDGTFVLDRSDLGDMFFIFLSR